MKTSTVSGYAEQRNQNQSISVLRSVARSIQYCHSHSQLFYLVSTPDSPKVSPLAKAVNGSLVLRMTVTAPPDG